VQEGQKKSVHKQCPLSPYIPGHTHPSAVSVHALTFPCDPSFRQRQTQKQGRAARSCRDQNSIQRIKRITPRIPGNSRRLENECARIKEREKRYMYCHHQHRKTHPSRAVKKKKAQGGEDITTQCNQLAEKEGDYRIGILPTNGIVCYQGLRLRLPYGAHARSFNHPPQVVCVIY